MVRFLLVLSTCLLLFATCAVAQVDSECLKSNLKNITSDKKVQLLTVKGERLDAMVERVDYESRTLTVVDMLGAEISGTTYHFDDLSGLRFQKPHRVKPLWMVAGTVAGALTGYALAKSGEDDDDSEFMPIVVPLLTLFGGGIGLLGGTFIPLGLSGGTVECGNFSP